MHNSQTYQLGNLILIQISKVVGRSILEEESVALGAVFVCAIGALLVHEAVTSTREGAEAKADGVDVVSVAPLSQVVAVATRVATRFDVPFAWDKPELDAAKVFVSCGAAGIWVQTAALDAIAGATTGVVETGVDSSRSGSETEEGEELHLVGCVQKAVFHKECLRGLEE
jgi:hypothetical protein